MQKNIKIYFIVAVIASLMFALPVQSEEIIYNWEEYKSGKLEDVFGNPGYTPLESFSSYQEATDLTKKVDKGELPPLSERLPNKPVVLPPENEIGEYGGTMIIPSWGGDLYSTGMFWYTWEPLFVLNNNIEMVPNVARSYEWNEDKSILTVNLREGLKWSDGHPYTADDILFHWEDFMLYSPDPEEEVVIPEHFRSPETGEPMKLEKVDNYTVNFIFDSPNPLFIQSLGHFGTYLPKHTLKEYHPRYTETTGEEAYEQFEKIIDTDSDYREPPVDVPTLAAWKFEDRKSGKYNVYKRNPYYWKVDSDGNQLPYIDEVQMLYATDNQMRVLNASEGKYHIEYAAPAASDLPLLHRKAEEGNYEVSIATGTDQSELDFNWDVPDEQLRELIRTRDFRIAISHAIDREEFNDLVYEGLWRPGRTFITPNNPNYEKLNIPEKWLEMYADYNPGKSNQMLDGLDLKKGDDGIRRFSNGEKVSFTYLTFSRIPEVAAELFKEFMKDIGIEFNVRVVDFTTWVDKTSENPTYEVTFHPNTGVIGLRPYVYSRMFAREPRWGQGMRDYGTSDYDPHPDVKKLHDLWKKGFSNPDPEERDRIVKEALRLYAENVYNIDMCGERAEVGVVSNELYNVNFDDMIWAGGTGIWGSARPEQFYLAQ